MGSDLIKQLRDIHYPEPIKMWPLAVGWYVLIAVCVCLIAIACYLWYHHYQRQRLKRMVLARLAELQQETMNATIFAELSMLLKRSALARYPRHEVAGLMGESWLHFLDKTSMSEDFSKGPGRLLLICPYQGSSRESPEQLFHLITTWVKKNL